MNVARVEIWPHVRTVVEGGYHYDAVGIFP